MDTLRTRVIRLAQINPALRPHLLKLLTRSAGVAAPGFEEEKQWASRGKAALLHWAEGLTRLVQGALEKDSEVDPFKGVQGSLQGFLRQHGVPSPGPRTSFFRPLVAAFGFPEATMEGYAFSAVAGALTDLHDTGFILQDGQGKSLGEEKADLKKRVLTDYRRGLGKLRSALGKIH